MSTSNEQWIVQPGTDVYGSDGTKVGSVDTIEGDYLVIRKGFFFPKDHYIPFSAISGHTDDRIDLGVTADQAKNEDWGQGVAQTTTAGFDTTPLSQTTSTTYDTSSTMAHDDTDLRGVVGSTDQAPFEHRNLGAAHIHETDDIVVPVTEEELTATKTAVERGAVRVETVASEREQTLEVPVTEERVHVERRTVSRDATADDLNLDNRTIEVPVYGEEVDTQKRARVVEEVEISKDAVQETRTVSDTVRRQDVSVVDGTVTTTGTVTDRDITLDSDLDRGTRRS